MNLEAPKGPQRAVSYHCHRRIGSFMRLWLCCQNIYTYRISMLPRCIEALSYRPLMQPERCIIRQPVSELS